MTPTNKKQLPLLKAVFILFSFAFVSPASAILDAQIGIGYANNSLKDNGSTAPYTIPDQTFKGAALNASAHINFSIPLVLSLGVGPYLTYAPDMNYTYANISGLSFSNTQFTIGGELFAKLLIIPAVSPYAKIGFGADTLKSVASASGVSLDAFKFSGSAFRVLLGLEVPIAGPVAIFGEAGFIAGTYDFSSLGISFPQAKTKSTGFIFNFGVSFGI
jgi:hypothetical protein